MSFYEDYYLSDNPFPTTPILDPSSDDARINGTIYNTEIMSDEIQSFQSKIRRRPPLIYIENSDFVRGVGKSALLVQQWRQLRSSENITSIYIRTEKKLKPADFAARLISRWHQDGLLWPTVLKTLTSYSKEHPHGDITPAGAILFERTFPELPLRTVPLLNFNVYNLDNLVTDLTTWVQKKIGESLHPEIAHVFFQSYLTDPRTFPDVYPGVLRRHKWDSITMLTGMYRLLNLGGFKYHYLFFDQFEDIVHGLSGKSLILFNTEMRRLIEASIGKATLVVTLHPGATHTLSSDEGGDITSIAPLDQRHVVDVSRLTQEGACDLARSYLNHFRLDKSQPPDDLYPFSSDAIQGIYHSVKGNIRACLQALNYALEKGIDKGGAIVNKDFLDAHHADITGRVHADEVIL